MIYDLKTATKWRVLDGHTGPITCISFNDKGEFLASYSDDRTVCVWKVGMWDSSPLLACCPEHVSFLFVHVIFNPFCHISFHFSSLSFLLCFLNLVFVLIVACRVFLTLQISLLLSSTRLTRQLLPPLTSTCVTPLLSFSPYNQRCD